MGTAASGPAYTVSYRAVDRRRKVGGGAADFIDDVPAGAVVVTVNPTSRACTTWGDLLTLTAVNRGIAGTVVSGFARDLRTIREQKYPLFSTGIGMVSAKSRLELEFVQEPVYIDGVRIAPGDLVTADENGVYVVPASRSEVVQARARSIDSVEADIAVAVKAGKDLCWAREKYGYAVPWKRSSL